ncbi:MAG: hypothetical protein U5M50_13060 [Sphingobium sp.]|nr:hypothetical protein [Sphingobium sp.]
MAIPQATSPCWLRLASGGLSKLQTQHLGTQMLKKRIELSHASPADKAREIYEYFSKWERILTDEIAQLH